MWPVPAAGGRRRLALLAGLAWLLAGRRDTWRLAPAAAALAMAGLLALGVLARVSAARPEYGVAGQGYAAALQEIEVAEGQQAARRGDGIVTIAPGTSTRCRWRDRGGLPIYGYATESLPSP